MVLTECLNEGLIIASTQIYNIVWTLCNLDTPYVLTMNQRCQRCEKYFLLFKQTVDVYINIGFLFDTHVY